MGPPCLPLCPQQPPSECPRGGGCPGLPSFVGPSVVGAGVGATECMRSREGSAEMARCRCDPAGLNPSLSLAM